MKTEMKTVAEVSRLSGVSVRTLHHYDATGLLRPTAKSSSGYRLYDDEAICRLKTILMFREAGFSLAEIKAILNNPGFDLKNALKDHIELLKLQRKHIDSLICEAEKMMKGEDTGFPVYDRTEMDKYAGEVKKKWGNTEAYREYTEKTKSVKAGDGNSIAGELMSCFKRIGAIKHLPANSKEAQDEIMALQEYITARFYNCTKEILSGLGEMYVSDERFRKNIDSAGGDGTAAFTREAIKIYCGK